MLTLNGAYGEGGGQILRTALSLAVILTQPICIHDIRKGRPTPGLAAQHLTAVRAAAMICDAKVAGAELGSTYLIFEPQTPPIPGLYQFDVAEARQGGSAGAATLVLQTILLPLSLADQPSTVTVRGGTHVSWSPSFHYLYEVYRPILAALGVSFSLELTAWGWYPAGGGEIVCEISPGPTELPLHFEGNLLRERGALRKISGVAVASSLPAHIAQRMSDRATKLLQEAGLPASIGPQRVRSLSPGAGIFLTAEYEAGRAGFAAIGRKGKPAEKVAEEAVAAALAFEQSEALVDQHLADQLILPLVLSDYSETLSVRKLSSHILTNLWVVEQFLGAVGTVDLEQNCIHFVRPAVDWSDQNRSSQRAR